MKNDGLRRLPPPPLFTIRPPPKPPGPLFEHFQTVEILNGQCVRPTLNLLNNSSSTILQKHEEQYNWINIFLLILAIISVVSCIIIAIFIFICLRKLKKEEKEYKSYVMTGSLSSRTTHHRHYHSDLCTRTSEHYKCTSNKFNCCDDYYSHQLIPLTETPVQPVISPHHIVNATVNPDSLPMLNNNTKIDNTQNHQYECIPEYFLTMSRHPHPTVLCHRQHQMYYRPNTCSVPYATFSRSLLQSRGVTTTTTTTTTPPASTSDSSQCTCSPPTSATVVQEESSTPLLASSIHKQSHQTNDRLMSSPRSMIIGWTRRNPSTSTKRKSMRTNGNEQKHSFLSHLRKSSVLK